MTIRRGRLACLTHAAYDRLPRFRRLAYVKLGAPDHDPDEALEVLQRVAELRDAGDGDGAEALMRTLLESRSANASARPVIWHRRSTSSGSMPSSRPILSSDQFLRALVEDMQRRYKVLKNLPRAVAPEGNTFGYARRCALSRLKAEGAQGRY